MYKRQLVSCPIRPFPEMALETVVFETPSASATSAIVIFFFSSFPIKPLLSSKQLLPLNCVVASCIARAPATMLLCPALMLLRILCATILLSSYSRKKAMTFLHIFQTIFCFCSLMPCSGNNSVFSYQHLIYICFSWCYNIFAQSVALSNDDI